MPYDSEGNFYRVHNWEEDRINDIDIVADRHDEEDDNFANGLSDCMLRDGRCTMTGNLKMGTFQIKEVANGTISTDAVNKGQLDSAKSELSNGTTTAVSNHNTDINAHSNKFVVVDSLPSNPVSGVFYFVRG